MGNRKKKKKEIKAVAAKTFHDKWMMINSIEDYDKSKLLCPFCNEAEHYIEIHEIKDTDDEIAEKCDYCLIDDCLCSGSEKNIYDDLHTAAIKKDREEFRHLLRVGKDGLAQLAKKGKIKELID